MIQTIKRWLARKKPAPKVANPPPTPRVRPARVTHLETVSRPPRAAFVRAPEVVVVEERVMLDSLNPLSPLNIINPISPFYSAGSEVVWEAPAPVYESPSCVDSSPIFDSPSYSSDPSPSYDCSSSSFDSSSIDYGSSSSSDSTW